MQNNNNNNSSTPTILVQNTDGDTRIMNFDKQKTVWPMKDIMKFIITIMIIVIVLSIFGYLIAVDWTEQAPGKIEWLIATSTFLMGTLIDGPKMISAAVRKAIQNKNKKTGLHTGSTPDHSQASPPPSPMRDDDDSQ